MMLDLGTQDFVTDSLCPIKMFEFYERVSGARMHAAYVRPGGVHQVSGLPACRNLQCLHVPSVATGGQHHGWERQPCAPEAELALLSRGSMLSIDPPLVF